MKILLLMLLAPSVQAQVNADVPFSLRQMETQKDIGAVNENFRAVGDAVRKSDLTGGGKVNGDLSPNRICFPDGTCQSTAYSGSFGIQTVTSTAIYTGTIRNIYVVVASTRPSGASTVYLYGLTTSYSYVLHYAYTTASAVDHFLRFNGDTGNNYKYGLSSDFTNATVSQIGSAGTSFFPLSVVSDVIAAGATIEGTVFLKPISASVLGITINSITANSAPTYGGLHGSGLWTGGSVSSLSIICGTCTGEIWLEAMVPAWRN